MNVSICKCYISSLILIISIMPKTMILEKIFGKSVDTIATFGFKAKTLFFIITAL